MTVLNCVPEPGIPDTAMRSRFELGIALYLTSEGHNHGFMTRAALTWVVAHSKFSEPAYAPAPPC